MNIWFVRHGQTEQNRQRLLQGRRDVPLNEAGRDQAQAAAAWFRAQGVTFDRIYASPLSRALETARIIAGPEAAILCDERLLEMDYGPYEGACLENPVPELARFFSDFVHQPAPEGMESLDHVKARAEDFLQEVSGMDAENILVVTHAILLKGALEALDPDSKGGWWSRFIATCDIFKVCRRGPDCRISRANLIKTEGE